MRLLGTVMLLALANAALTITVTKSSIFQPLRDYFKPVYEGTLAEWVHQLLSCAYCFSHWGALFLYLLAVPLGEWRWFLPAWLMIVALTAPLMLMMGWSLGALRDLATKHTEEEE